MAQRTDYAGLQQLSALEWENQRSARIRALSRSLAHIGEAARALPADYGDMHRQLGAVDDAVLTELARQFTVDNPFRR